MITCPACGRRVFTASLNTCPECGAKLKDIRAGEPAYASDLGADAAPAKPDSKAPLELLPGDDLVPAGLQAVPVTWIRKGLLVLLAFVACVVVGSRLLERAESSSNPALRKADRARCEALCPGGERMVTHTVSANGKIPPGGDTVQVIDDEGCGPCKVRTHYTTNYGFATQVSSEGS